MAHGDFVWGDLSAYRPEAAKAFYADLFGWRYQRIRQEDGAPYDIASTEAGEAAAIFEMPPNLREIGMPSFWMPYFEVKDAASTIALARDMGGKVEIGPLPAGGGAVMALIRDPLGAGFTVYQGHDLEPRGSAEGRGQIAWAELYFSDAAAVAPFYRALFGWEITPDADGVDRLTAATHDGHPVAALQQAGKELRGEFEFWGLHFRWPGLGAARAALKAQGGAVTYEAADGLILANDPDGAAFFLCEA
ncbi:MAG: VOC family protein [Pseudomonadota bacterium]